MTHHGRLRFRPPTEIATEPKVLVLFCHPQAHQSRVNRTLLSAIRGLPGVTVHDLYESYPDHAIDVAREQELLTQHETVVLQHPFYWYSTPPLLKEWLDVVLTWGWAYGPGGAALNGKWLLSALSTAGPEEAYASTGSNRFTLGELLAPMSQTAWLCGMKYLPPFAVHGTHKLDDEAIRRAAVDYSRVIEALRDRRVPLDRIGSMARINEDLGWMLQPVGVS